MKSLTVWARIVLAIYVVAVTGVCMYVPMYLSYQNGNQLSLGYEWLWNLTRSSKSDMASLVDYGRVVLEVVSLTAIAGLLLLIGSLVGGRKRGQRPDPSTL